MTTVIPILPAHSKLGASSADRWMACPGSVSLSAGVERHTSAYAEEGTRAHTLAERALSGVVDSLSDVDESKHDEMREAAEVYADAVLLSMAPDDVLLVEHKFHLKDVHPDLFGTADAVVWRPATRRLSVYDFKYGAGVPVEVEGNTQEMYYALGALLESGYPALSVELVIVQPRCHHPDGPVRRHVVPANDLLDFVDSLLAAVRKTEAADAALIEGAHCRWCPAAGICPRLQEAAREKAKMEFAPGLPYDAKQLADTLHWLPVLEGWITSVREFAYGELDHGRELPGYKLVMKRANRKWASAEQAAAALQDIFGLRADDIYTDPKLRTPAQIEKLLTKGQKPELAALVIKQSTGQTLVPNSDKREAVKRDAASDFSTPADTD